MEQLYTKYLSATTLNHYYEGMRLVLGKLKFDLFSNNYFGNYQKIKKLKNRYAGKKCVILCNGPSLNNVDFDMLSQSNVFTIGLNKINLLFDKTQFRPNFIACVNPFVLEQNKDFFMATSIPLFLDFAAFKQCKLRVKDFNKNSQLHILHSSTLHGRFAGDISSSVCQGSTVTYVALQLAFHLGFEEVTLVGCDHSFASKGSPNKTIKLDTQDNNHFDPNYFTTKDLWQLPDLLSSEYHYQLARETYLNAGKKIYNSTEGGLLEIYERKSLKDFLTD
ncbi:hypothetical protein Emtol_4295 [Emticicia oligotrophica DSM 17448]|uniref:6-hydroxymethylpterin diphosphokinase MptE-like domain-containing protein n=1 Tax=Emticicia oligotrophica (strain DSM 17448 / CIP 109782 / MTCC 6937 / GPTSA100-15) TaxID=929562 RepID=A0ABM5N7E6_EMTOG|nr:6-hydroxymethylpterin diphosphokinase MptE-like protein [Emticicia oligotrophica]AFK05418.1 hypothetical protein Emtol_4295 [Emticicia oligotrophica DSM 17448]